MHKIFVLISLVIPFIAIGQPLPKSTTKEYIEKYKMISIAEMLRTGIPASITLAQGILESGSGNSLLTRECNNHFGIKCHKTWSGKKMYHDDDAKGECFRCYNTPEESFLDHSNFLKTGQRYAFLFQLDAMDYKGWAAGLRKAGYATDPQYPAKLIKIIEENELYKYDDPKNGIFANTPAEDIITVNGVLAVTVKPGDDLKSLAKKYGVSVRRLCMYNELDKTTSLTPGDNLFLKAKKSKSKSARFHKVAAGESMHDISQIYGIKLKHLYKRNRMKKGEEPATEEVLWLQRKRVAPPLLKTDVKAKEPEVKEHKPDIQDTQKYHVVIEGETLYAISRQYNISVEDIKKWNNLPGDNIRVGDKLIIGLEKNE